MKKTLQIAGNELRILFYSPVAWLILVIFTVQSFTAFTSSLSMALQALDFGWGLMGDGLSEGVFTNANYGYYNQVLRYLYLYIPLLTMSLMSREFSSGSIKLLYSSPVSNKQIIMGKYVAMLGYGLALIFVLLIQMCFGMYFIPNFDVPAILAAMCGVFLLVATYAAIGLFMSCLTQYQVVAAMLTLAMLSLLDQIGGWGQDYEFMRNVAYWLSLRGRVYNFLSGMIDTENTLYFVLVSATFLWLSIIRLNANRQKQKFSSTFAKYAGVICVACVFGYFTSLPIFKLYLDTSDTQRNTLTKNTRDIIEKMGDEDLTITAYVNALDTYDFWYGLPSSRMSDMKFWEMYTRFKPSIKLDYVLYYDSVLVENRPRLMIATAATTAAVDEEEEVKEPTLEDELNEICRAYGDLDKSLFITPDSIHKLKDLREEKNVFVRELTCSNGNKTYLRMFNDAVHVPTEAEIAAAFKRLVMDLPVVGFAEGQGERDYHGTSDREYNFAIEPQFRPALFNQGFDVQPVNFANGIPDSVNIVVIGEMKRPFDEIEQAHFDEYINRGGNLLVITEPRRRESMSALLDQFGVRQDSGVLVHKTSKFDPTLALFRPTTQAAEKFYRLNWLEDPTSFVTMPSCSPLAWSEDKGYDVMPLLEADSLFWNEMQTTDFVDDTAHYEPSTGEVQKRYYGALALSRLIGDKEQRIVILPDADCLSNQETNAYRNGIRNQNFSLINTMFAWMSYDEVPVDVRRPQPKDTKFNLVKEELTVWEYILHWSFPILLLLAYLLIWLRRRNR